MFIASFDIGKKNLAFCVEKFDQNVIDENTIIDDMCKTGEIVCFENKSLMKNCDTKKYLDTEVFHNLTKLFDENMELWNSCDVFLIEQQMNRNIMALKIGQHCFSYFLFKFGRTKRVIEFAAYHKTQALNAPRIPITKLLKNGTEKTLFRNMTKPERKKWSVKRTNEILTMRDDISSLDKLKGMRKRDDVSDCILMIQAYKFLLARKQIDGQLP
jgi:hypothetical protein